MPRPRSSWRCSSSAALLTIAAGCAGYVLTDRAFRLNGFAAYTWVTAYFLIISVEMCYGKHIVGPHLGFASMCAAPGPMAPPSTRGRVLVGQPTVLRWFGWPAADCVRAPIVL